MRRLFSWLETLVDPFPKGPPESPPERLVAFIVYYSRPFLPLLGVSLLLMSSVALLEVALLSLMASLVDRISQGSRADLWATLRSELILIGIVALIALPVTAFLADAVDRQSLRGSFAMRTRWLTHRYLLRQSIDFFANDFAGRIATKVMQTALAVRDVVMTMTGILAYSAVYSLAALFVIASKSPWMAGPLLLWLIAYGIVGSYFVPRISRLSKRQADYRSVVTGHLVDCYTNIATLKLYANSREDNALDKHQMQKMLVSVNESMRLSTRLTASLQILSGILLSATAVVSILLWQHNFVTVGSIALAITVSLRMNAMSQWIVRQLSELYEEVGIIQDGMNTIANKYETTDPQDALHMYVSQGAVEFAAVTFRYNSKPTHTSLPVIEELNLSIAAGEKVGIVGRSGAGKSTLAGLLLRLHDPVQGRILIDGQDIAKVTQDSLRSNIGVVTQEISLFHRSVLENIRCAAPDANLEAIQAAAKRAHAHEFVCSLRDPAGRRGYDAVLGERGAKLSGGQRQRIALARLFLKNAPILLLDEATSALDSEVEREIQDSLFELMEGRTVISIAHRLSTLLKMDRIVVIDKGRIVEQGSHSSLISSGGLYATLWHFQSSGFLAS